MPQYFDYKCDNCDFNLPRGCGGYMYVTNDKGERVICGHPGEAFVISKVLGISEKECFFWLTGELDKISSETKKLINDKVGFNSDCLCLDCLGNFVLDIKKDKRICPKCRKNNIKTVTEMPNQPCPKCKKGIIAKINTGIIS